MSKLRVNEITDLNDNLLWNVAEGVGGAAVSTESGDQTLNEALDSRLIYSDTIPEVVVGASGLATINEAISFLSRRRSAAQAIIRLESGFVMQEQLIVRGRDLSWITIVSDDAEVPIDKSFMTIKVGDPAEYVYNPRVATFAGLDGASLPTIGCLFNMNQGQLPTGVGRIDGIFLTNSSNAKVEAGSGIINADETGVLLMNSSRLSANGANFSNSGMQGVYALHSCLVSFNEGVANNCGWTAFQMQSSNGSCSDASLQNSGHYGCRSRNGANIDAMRANVSGATDAGFNIYMGSNITAELCVADNIPGQYGAIVQAGCTANFSGGSFKNCADMGVRSSGGSIVNASIVDTTGTPNGLVCDSGSILNARQAIGTTNQPRNDYTNKGVILDDYPGTRSFREEGEWTPTLVGGTVAGSHTYDLRSGYFHRVGNQVTLIWSLRLASKDAAMEGQVRITGHPFSIDRTFSAPGMVSQISSVTAPADFGGSWLLNTPANFLRLSYVSDTGNTTVADASHVGGSFIINGSITYFTDALV